jgi:hypothetical protein
MKNKLKNIIIANDAEAFNFIIRGIDDNGKRTAKINKEHFLSNRFLFWERDDKVVITPYPIEKSILAQAQFLGYKNVENWYPSKININLSDAIIKDKVLLNNLKKIIKDNPGIILSPYSFTNNFSHLVDLLKEANLKFHVDQQPRKESEWLVDYLGSKVGFRAEMQKLQKILQPKFFVAKNKKEITESVIWFFKHKASCVIKANSGEGGWGVIMAHKENYFSEKDLVKKIQHELNKDTIWNKGPFIVEELIPSLKNTGSSPSVEVFVDDNGFKITYVCNQMISPSGAFLGILMGKVSFKDNADKKINTIGKIIATRYFKLGYRGFFDIDFIVSKNGILYPIETNVRRTGGTHVFDLTRKLFGERWMHKTMVLSVDLFCYGNNSISAEAIQNKISKLIFPMKGEKKGVVVVAVNRDKPYFSFIIFAPTKLEIMRIYKKLTSSWGKDTLKTL